MGENKTLYLRRGESQTVLMTALRIVIILMTEHFSCEGLRHLRCGLGVEVAEESPDLILRAVAWNSVQTVNRRMDRCEYTIDEGLLTYPETEVTPDWTN